MLVGRLVGGRRGSVRGKAGGGGRRGSVSGKAGGGEEGEC